MITKIFSQLRVPALAILVLALTGSCNELLEQTPPLTGSNVLPSEAIKTEDDLQELLNSSYDVLANTYNGVAQNPFTLLSDQLIRPVNQDDYTSVWLRSTTIFNGTVSNAFRQFAIANLRANTVIENLDRIEMTPEARNRRLAEARFIRALCHLDMVRGWAQPYGYTPSNSHPGIAIHTGTTVENEPRQPVSAVYAFILAELQFAKENLPSENEVYATRWSAMALEAEVHFQMHNYEMAAAVANEVLTNSPYSFDNQVNKYQFPQVSPEALFYINSTILSTEPDTVVDSRIAGFKDNYDRAGNPALRLQPELYDLMTQLGEGTPRGQLYREIDQDGNITYATNMFNNPFFNVPVLTVTQMMLIRAESNAELGTNLTQSIEDINAIRERAYDSPALNLTSTATAAEVIEAARLERRLELPFTGQRFHDIKRIGSQGEEIIVRGAPWDCPGMILQFPATERTDLFPLNPTGGC